MMIRILLYKGNYWWANIVQTVTGSNYYHAALWIDGYIYEEVAYFDQNKKWISGVKKREAGLSGDVYKLRDEVVVDESEVKKWAEKRVKEHTPYNLPLLIAMPIIYPLRWLWRLLKWSPFKPAVFGYICSSFVDWCLLQGGVDLLPDNYEWYTTPGDLAKSELLERVES